MIAFLGFLEHFEIVVQFLLAREGGSVNALKHCISLVAPPICAGAFQELIRLYLTGVVDMRAAAQIHKIAFLINANYLVFRQVVYKLDFVWLIRKKRKGFVASYFFAHKRIGGLYDVGHLRCDLVEVFWSKRLIHVKIVVKPFLNRRPDRHSRTRIQILHRMRHHVGGAVSQGM